MHRGNRAIAQYSVSIRFTRLAVTATLQRLTSCPSQGGGADTGSSSVTDGRAANVRLCLHHYYSTTTQAADEPGFLCWVEKS